MYILMDTNESGGFSCAKRSWRSVYFMGQMFLFITDILIISFLLIKFKKLLVI